MPNPPKLRSDLVSTSTEIEGAIVFTVKDPIRGTYFRLREPEHWLINQLDGLMSFADIAAGFKEKYGFELTADQVGQFALKLESLFFLENSRSEQAVSRFSYGADTGESLISRLLYIKFKALDPARILNTITKWYRPLHTFSGFTAQALVIFLGLWVMMANSAEFVVSLYSVFELASLITVVISFFIMIIMHEFAHAVVCRYHGGEVREMGFLLMYFQPCFYCDLSDAWLFEKKKNRLAVTAAGPYFQLLLLAIAVLVWRVTIPGALVNDIAHIVAIVCFVTLVFNLNPLIKLDGYYLLSDWLDIPNLRAKAFGYAGAWLKSKILGWPEEIPEVDQRHRRIYQLYSLLAILYSAFLIIYMLYLLGSFLYSVAGGTGLLLLGVAVLFTLRSSLVKLTGGFVKHMTLMKSILKKSPIRLIVHLILLIGAILILFIVPFKQRVTGEIVVRPIAAFSVKVNDLGLLEKQLRTGGANPDIQTSYVQMTTTEMATLSLRATVPDGQRVVSGDTVAVLLSNQVTNDLRAGEAALEQLQFQMDLLKAPPKPEEVDEAASQVKVIQTNLDQLKRELARVEALRKKDISTDKELEVAQAEVSIARANLQTRQASLELLRSPPKKEEESVLQAEINQQEARLQFLYSQYAAQSILSPIDGSISLTSGSAILKVSNLSRVEMLIPVEDFDLGLIEIGQTVKSKVRSYVDRVFEGRVVHIPSDARMRGGRSAYLVSAEFDNISDSNNIGSLRQGMTGYAKIEIRDTTLFRLILRKVTSIIRVEFWSWW